ncbi:Aste57867_1445 [Aphanomyces stellatus]|uniref:Aste57867_1445 protein n=1 Tax=Aphanomyces stellatus TaxID=120398 RepID=A0A485K541_9STRA|nr:hypothetical protein As57867_001444 [Aphanomyces stellatus]VFT78662.1 Aste57867_1445 [Aphanomyces stellatus]
MGFQRADNAFGMHLYTCSSEGDAEGVSSYPKCNICFKVFGLNTPANEIAFHKEECERVNGPPPKKTGPQKRRRGSDADKPTSSSRAVPPSASPEPTTDMAETATLCFVCGLGGRQLVSCTATCARSFHVNCIGESAVLTQRQGQSARKTWKCADCNRKIHTCVACGFLGDDGFDLFPCTAPACGFYCHERCMGAPTTVNPATFTCARHSCKACLRPATAAADGIFCYRCPTTLHKTCNAKSAPPRVFANPTGSFGNCGTHPVEPLPSHLKSKFLVGDVVLVLEFANDVLSARAKNFNGNQWGRVLGVENLDGGQLLNVELFACGSAISVPGHYLLHIRSNYAPTPECLQDCMSSHVHAELNMRDPTGGALSMTQSQKTDAMMDTCLAFQNWGRELRMTSTQMIEMTKRGFQTWKIQRQPHEFLDTRRRRKKKK